MLNLYSHYWKNAFNYKDRSNFKELICAVLFNSLMLISIYFIGLFAPPSLENTIVNLFYLIRIVMIFPTISLLFRLIKNYV